MPDATRRLELVKGRHRFAWVFRDGQQQELLANLLDLAEDPKVPVTHEDVEALTLAIDRRATERRGCVRDDHKCSIGRERYDH